MNHERYWLPRLPNTLAWLHGEMFDIEEALRLNLEGSGIAREMQFPEGDANSQINLALNYLSLGEPDRARDHLSAAETLLADDEWFRWVYTIRFHAAFAGPVVEGPSSRSRQVCEGVPRARQCDTPTQAHRVGAQAARRRRRDGGPATDAVASYLAGLSELQHHPCPSVQWKISAALAATHAKLRQSEETAHWRAATHVCFGSSPPRSGRPLQTRFRESPVAREFGAF